MKLGLLAVKTISKPVATQLKSYAKEPGIFRSSCALFGQSSHIIGTRLNVRLLGHRINKVKPLGEAEAVAKGADLFGELFIYTVSGGAIVFEYSRSSKESERKAQDKKERQRIKEQKMHDQLSSIHKRIDELHEETKNLKSALAELEEKKEKQQAVKPKSWFLF